MAVKAKAVNKSKDRTMLIQYNLEQSLALSVPQFAGNGINIQQLEDFSLCTSGNIIFPNSEALKDFSNII